MNDCMAVFVSMGTDVCQPLLPPVAEPPPTTVESGEAVTAVAALAVAAVTAVVAAAPLRVIVTQIMKTWILSSTFFHLQAPPSPHPSRHHPPSPQLQNQLSLSAI